jgi:transposase
VVLVEDEAKVQKESHSKSVWSPKGKQAEIKVEQKKGGMSYSGALNVKTGECHGMEFERQLSKNTVHFLKGLEKAYKGKKVLLIWDGAPWHRGEVKKYLKQKHKKFQLRIEYFPPYWPKLYPQERVWKDAKQHTCHNSELPYEEKLLNFWKYITSTTFETHFLDKYTLTCN